MGFCQSWVSLRGATQDTLCAELGLQRTGTFNEVTDAPFSGRQLRTGWALVVMDGSSSALDGTVDLARLSKLGDVVACFVEEHVMCSTAAFWSGGRELWMVGHEAEKGRRHLKVAGSPPSGFEQVVSAATREQDANGGDESDVDFSSTCPSTSLKRRLDIDTTEYSIATISSKFLLRRVTQYRRGPGGGSEHRGRQTTDEFIERGIAAIHRMQEGF